MGGIPELGLAGQRSIGNEGGIHTGLAGMGCGVDLSCPVEGGEAAQTLASLENQAEELG